MMFLRTAVLSLLVFGASGEAFSEELEQNQPYTSKIVTADSITALVFVPSATLNIADPDSARAIHATFYFGHVLSSLLSVPIIHATEGNWGRAFGSLGIRFGTMFGSGILINLAISAATKVDFTETGTAGTVALYTGFLLGQATSFLIDALLLSD